MAVTLILSTAKLSSISVPSLDEVSISYVLGFTDAGGLYHDVLLDSAVCTVTMPLQAGSPIPAARDLVGLIVADVQARFAAAPDSVSINGVDIPVESPGPPPVQGGRRLSG